MVGIGAFYALDRSITNGLAAIGSAEATEGAANVLAQLGGGKLRSVFNRFANIDASVDAKQGELLWLVDTCCC